MGEIDPTKWEYGFHLCVEVRTVVSFEFQAVSDHGCTKDLDKGSHCLVGCGRDKDTEVSRWDGVLRYETREMVRGGISSMSI